MATRVVPERGNEFVAQVPLNRSRVRNVLPGLSVDKSMLPRRLSPTRARPKAVVEQERVRFQEPKRLNPLSTLDRARTPTPRLNDRPAQTPAPRTPTRIAREPEPAPSVKPSAQPSRVPTPKLERIKTPDKGDPMEPSRSIVFSETDSSFSRIANPAKIADRPEGHKPGVPKPPGHDRVRFRDDRTTVEKEPPQGDPEPMIRVPIGEKVRHRAEEMRELERDEQRERESLLYEFHRLEQEGVPMTRKFDMHSNLDAMRFEYQKLTADQGIKSGVNFAKKSAMLGVSALEFLNNSYDPFGVSIKGFSDEFMSKWDEDYKPDVYRLYKSWNKRSSGNPMASLAMTFVVQLVTFVVNNAMTPKRPTVRKMPTTRPIAQPGFAPAQNTMPGPSPAYQTPAPVFQPQYTSTGQFSGLGPLPVPGVPPIVPGATQGNYSNQWTPAQASQVLFEQQQAKAAAEQANLASRFVAGPSVPLPVPQQQAQQQAPIQAQSQQQAQQQQQAPSEQQAQQQQAQQQGPISTGRRRRMRPPQNDGVRSLLPVLAQTLGAQKPPEPVTSVYADLQKEKSEKPEEEKENERVIDLTDTTRRRRRGAVEI